MGHPLRDIIYASEIVPFFLDEPGGNYITNCRRVVSITACVSGPSTVNNEL
jgi:hypothetical protein